MTAEQLDAWAGQYDETTVPGSVVLPAARWWDVQKALRHLADLRRSTGTAKEIVAAVCAAHENPQLAAKSPFILAAFDEALAASIAPQQDIATAFVAATRPSFYDDPNPVFDSSEPEDEK